MSGATAERTFSPSATTSGPMPSPEITARRMTANPRSDGGEVGCAGLARTDAPGDVVERLAAPGAAARPRHERLSPARRAAHLRAGDVDAGLAQHHAHRADHPGPVGVGEEQQVTRG